MNTSFNSQHGELVVKLIQNIDLQIQNQIEQIRQQKIIIDFYKQKLDNWQYPEKTSTTGIFKWYRQ